MVFSFNNGDFNVVEYYLVVRTYEVHQNIHIVEVSILRDSDLPRLTMYLIHTPSRYVRNPAFLLICDRREDYVMSKQNQPDAVVIFPARWRLGYIRRSLYSLMSG